MHFSPSGADFPTLKGYNWSDDKTLKIDFFLEPSHRYGFMVYGAAFTTKDGHSADKSLEINFRTGE